MGVARLYLVTPIGLLTLHPYPAVFFFSILISQIKFAHKQNTAVNENRFSAADFPH